MSSAALSAPAACNLRMIGGARYTARAQWDSLARRGFHRHAWFVAAEACGAEPRHIGVFKGGELVAVIPAYIERPTLSSDLHARWYGPAQGIAASFGGRLRPALTIGAPMSTSSDPLGSDDALTEAVLDEAFELFEAEARAEGAKAIVWPFVDARAMSIREIARRRGFRESIASSEAVIDVRWSSADEYLASQPRNVRRTLLNELAWIHDEGARVSWEHDLRPHAETLDALYRASFVTRHGRVATLPPQFLAELAAQRSEGLRAQCAWKGETLLQMAVALDGGGALDLGLSAQSDATRRGLLYQHCLCYDPIRHAIASGHTRLNLGPSALYAKLLRGARLESRVTLVRGLAPFARAALRVLAPLTNVRNRAKHRRLVARITTASHAP